jgi:adenosylmethionine-8-amino-7-oxononanoate aminotransferase
MDQVRAISAQLGEGLAPCRVLPGVADVRVKGAIGVVELTEMRDLAGLKRRLVEQGVWIRPFGRIIYLTPAFMIDRLDADRLCAAIHQTLGDMAG